MDTFFIVNPTARRHRCRSVWNKIKPYINFAFDYKLTTAPGEGEELAKRALDRGFKRIVAVGGDGTISEVVNALANTDAVLGIVPAGTGNDFVKTLGIPLEPAKALSHLERGIARAVDLGRLNNRYFINVAGAGLDAEVVRATNEDVSLLTGAPAYVYALITTLLKFSPRNAMLEIDGTKMKRKLWLVSVANGRYYGGGLMISPDSVVDDGYLDVCMVNEISRLEITRFLPRVFTGKHKAHPAFEVVRAKNVKIHFEETTMVQADGEILGQAPLEISIEHHALKVIR